MKKAKLFLVGCIFLASPIDATYFSGPLYSDQEIQLRDILATNLEKLSREAIAVGDPINAISVEVRPEQVPFVFTHVGVYFGAEIKTLIVRDNNFDPTQDAPAGVQTIQFRNPIDFSVSTSWTVETVNTVDYIVHDHGDFLVYSNADSQYVELKNF